MTRWDKSTPEHVSGPADALHVGLNENCGVMPVLRTRQLIGTVVFETDIRNKRWYLRRKFVPAGDVEIVKVVNWARLYRC